MNEMNQIGVPITDLGESWLCNSVAAPRPSRAPEPSARVFRFAPAKLAHWDFESLFPTANEPQATDTVGGVLPAGRPDTPWRTWRAIRAVEFGYQQINIHSLAAPKPKPQLDVWAATTTDAIVAILKLQGWERTADQVVHLSTLRDDDPEGTPLIELDLFKRVTLLMLAKPHWGEPSLTPTDEGWVHASWSTTKGGRVSMTFLPAGRIDYSAFLARPSPDERVLNIGGHHLEKEAIKNLNWFFADRTGALR